VVSPQRARPAPPPVMHRPASEPRCGPGEYRWGLSRVDGGAHAIDPGAKHPALVYLARCGHAGLRRTPLDEAPQCPRCPACVRGGER
jgi:hypothetical protein